MKKKHFILFASLLLILMSCNNNDNKLESLQSEKEVKSQTETDTLSQKANHQEREFDSHSKKENRSRGRYSIRGKKKRIVKEQNKYQPKIDDMVKIISNGIFYKTQNDIGCFPHTTTKDYQNVFKINNQYYFNFKQTFAILTKENKLNFVRLPISTNLEWTRISSLECINDTIWISTSRGEMFLYDVKKDLMIDAITTNKKNFSITYDYNYNIFWVSSLGSMDIYNKNNDEWINLNSKFPELNIGKPSSYHNVIIDNDNVWILANGGILNYNYLSKDWNGYSDELTDLTDIPFDLFYPRTAIASNDFLWVLSSVGGNAIANLRLALMNKTSRKWVYYHPNDFSQLKKVLSELKECKRFEILSKLIHRTKEYKYFYKKSYSSEHIKKKFSNSYFSNDTNKINQSIIILDSLFNKIENKEKCRSLNHKYYTKNNKIYFTNDNLEEDSLLYLMRAIEYRRILASYEHFLLVGTNLGIALVDLKEQQIIKIFQLDCKYNYFSDSINGFYCIDKKIYLFNEREIGEDYTPPGAKIHIYEINMLDHSFKETEISPKKYRATRDSLGIAKTNAGMLDHEKHFIDLEGLKILYQ